MRTLRYLPLVTIAGVDGFALFLPYLMVVVVAAYAAGRVNAQPVTPAPAAA